MADGDIKEAGSGSEEINDFLFIINPKGEA
jgi:hypothetical protein